MAVKLDILVMAVHPDDAELGCSGTIAKHISMGYKVGIVDFTRGELGTRGSAEIRDDEAAASAKVMGLAARKNLRFRDGFFKNDEEHQMKLMQVIRKYQPEIVLANGISDRHPDHGRSSALAVDACFYAGLRMVPTYNEDGSAQKEWRPKHLYHYIQDRYIEPDFVIDITDFWDVKDKAIRAFGSQFYDPNSADPQSYISSPDFLDFVEARSREMGHKIGVKYGEGFTSYQTQGVSDLMKLS
ncbi:bacillithiol biosynthesis deacetylase BshB1 [uncultured Arcticibacterium sp.]|uniref:bacillithiol biosynthesis deacetylase BshB1 n=1 Tax=uncultured Arcticibacterium sp. TaxID=2173042 RepID=UPI0030F8CE89